MKWLGIAAAWRISAAYGVAAAAISGMAKGGTRAGAWQRNGVASGGGVAAANNHRRRSWHSNAYRAQQISMANINGAGHLAANNSVASHYRAI